MPYRETVYNRTRLYEEVWSAPMTEVAKKYGVSDVALRKTCRTLGVPLPQQGYWLMRADRRPERWPLAPLEPGQDEELVVAKWVSPPPPPPSPETLELEALIAKRPDLQYMPVPIPFRIEVPKTTHGLHPLAAAARKEIRNGGYGRDGLCERSGGLRVNVSKGQVDRALRILSCLFRALEKAGNKVVPSTQTSPYGMWTGPHFLLDGEKMEFFIRERLSQSPHVPQPNEIYAPKFDHRPKGDLRLTIGNLMWEDHEKRRIEDQINGIFESLLIRPVHAKVDEARRKERERIYRAAEGRREEARREEAERQRKLAEEEAERKRRIAELVSHAEGWERVALVRRFIAAVRARLNERAGPTGLPKATVDWLNWAEATANGLDPLLKLVPDEVPRG